jgi:hypothetical protein
MVRVPIVGDIDRPERRTLIDENGLPIARYVRAERDGRAIADLLELAVPVERAVPYVAGELAGMRIAGSEELGRALVQHAGARLHRHAHVYSHDLRERPPQADDYVCTPVDRPATELLPVYLAAFGPGHPDRMQPHEAARHLDAILAGKLGGLLEGSGLAIVGGDVVAAALIGSVADAPPPFGGPWIMEIFSTARGAGRALLRRALNRTEGSLGLAVTDGNPAERVYVDLGFTRVFTAYSVDL